jgi:hypothetical protein
MGQTLEHWQSRTCAAVTQLQALMVQDVQVRPANSTAANPTAGLWLLAAVPGGAQLMLVDGQEGRVRSWESFAVPVCLMACRRGPDIMGTCRAALLLPPCPTVLGAVTRHLDAAARHRHVGALAIVGPTLFCTTLSASLGLETRRLVRLLHAHDSLVLSRRRWEALLFGRNQRRGALDSPADADQQQA